MSETGTDGMTCKDCRSIHVSVQEEQEGSSEYEVELCAVHALIAELAEYVKKGYYTAEDSVGQRDILDKYDAARASKEKS